MSVALFAIVAGASAETPVVYAQGDVTSAIERLRKHPDIEDEGLYPVTLQELSQKPIEVQGGAAATCDGAPVDLAKVLSLIKQAEGELLYLDYGKALDSLGQASSSLVCLGGAADRDVISRVFYLQGYARFSSGGVEEAREHFRRLFQIRRDYPWDEAFPPDGKQVFEATRAEFSGVTPVTLDVVPTPPGSTVLVDGAVLPPSRTLLPGTHLLQVIGESTHTLELEVDGSGPVVVVWPQLLPPTGISWMNEVSGQTQFAALLDATLAEPTLIVTSPTETWRRDSADEGFVSLSSSIPEFGPQRSRWILLGGSVLATGGATLAVLSAGQARQAAELADRTGDQNTYTGAEDDYLQARRQRDTALVLTSGGVLAAGVGVAIPIAAGLRVAPGTLDGSPGFTLTFRR